MSNACAVPVAQAQEWQDKYHKLHERHLSARSEFDKLKHISSERKAKIAALQQQVCWGAKHGEDKWEEGENTCVSAAYLSSVFRVRLSLGYLLLLARTPVTPRHHASGSPPLLSQHTGGWPPHLSHC